jgi:molybdopterin-guanine dinucleotide biosynthesis protein A
VDHDAIVLAGGAGRRLGGVDKALIPWRGALLIEHVLEVVEGAGRIIVAGPRRPVSGDFEWVQEDPPGSGPAHGLAAAMNYVSAPLVVVLACDLPFVSSETVERLLDSIGDSDGALVRDAHGQAQPLLGVYRTSALSARLQGLDTRGASMHEVIAELRLEFVDDPKAARDIDTPEDCE